MTVLIIIIIIIIMRKFMLILSNTKPFKHVHVTGAPKEGAAELKTPQIETRKKFCRHDDMACYT
jgi:hypothetical protein